MVPLGELGRDAATELRLAATGATLAWTSLSERRQVEPGEQELLDLCVEIGLLPGLAYCLTEGLVEKPECQSGSHAGDARAGEVRASEFA